jgi:hypothetical protein
VQISARNFRIRRKGRYHMSFFLSPSLNIVCQKTSTLKGDIAERDRFLNRFRTQLGSHESENLAALKSWALAPSSLRLTRSKSRSNK